MGSQGVTGSPMDFKELVHVPLDQLHDFFLALWLPVAEVDPSGDRQASCAAMISGSGPVIRP